MCFPSASDSSSIELSEIVVPSTAGRRIEGWLWKLGKSGMWVRRWCILDPPVLRYYDHDPSELKDARPKGQVNLTDRSFSVRCATKFWHCELVCVRSSQEGYTPVRSPVFCTHARSLSTVAETLSSN